MSIAGGYYTAVDRAAAAGCDCVQLFTKNNNQWRAKPLSEEDIAKFQQTLQAQRMGPTLSHASYLINLASPDKSLWRRSVEGMVIELQRAAALGIPAVVVHPGAAMGASERVAIGRVVRALNEVVRQSSTLSTKCLLETTAGQGSTLGWKFEHLGQILDQVKVPERFAVCLDTCHIFAAGYRFQSPSEYADTMDAFDRVVGLNRLEAFHLNDSKTPCGSRVDRHEHIGRGRIGARAFGHLMRDERFRSVPMFLETPKGTENGRDLDRMNLARLRRLCRR